MDIQSQIGHVISSNDQLKVNLVLLQKTRDEEIVATQVRLFRTIRLKALQSDPGSFCAKYEDEVRQPDAFWEERLRTKNVQQFLVIDDHESDTDSIVGLIVVVAVGSTEAQPTSAQYELAGFWIQSSDRGKGVGSKVLSSVKSWVMDHAGESTQHVRLNASVKSSNIGAQNFYKRCGFLELQAEADSDVVLLTAILK